MCSKDMQRLRSGPRKTLRRPAAAICPPKAPEKGYAVQRLSLALSSRCMAYPFSGAIGGQMAAAGLLRVLRGPRLSRCMSVLHIQ